MTLGFSSPERMHKLKQELSNWTLSRVEVDKFHVMFWFEEGRCLLNAAYRFDFRSADGTLSYTYDVQADGAQKFLNVEPILRQSIKTVESLDDRRLALNFEAGDQLIIHDSPKMRSVWFIRFGVEGQNGSAVWAVDDLEPDDLA